MARWSVRFLQRAAKPGHVEVAARAPLVRGHVPYAHSYGHQRAVAAGCGFAATVKAVETVIDAGRTIDRAAIATCAKRILEGRTAEGGQGLKRYDKYMEETE